MEDRASLAVSHQEMARLRKLAVYGVAAIVGAVVLRRVVVNVVDRIRDGKTARDLSNATEPKASGMTISATDANVIAEQLHAAMADTGTDTGVIERLVSKLQTADDWKAVIQKFGYRDYGTYGTPLYSWLPSSKKNLLDWFRAELSGGLLRQIEDTVARLNLPVV